MAGADAPRYTFVVEWLDPAAQIVRNFQLTFFDGTPPQIEMFDTKMRRMFLKKSRYDGIALKDLYVGATVTVYSRQLKVVEYGDGQTSRLLQASRDSTVALVSSESRALGQVLQAADAEGFTLANIRSIPGGTAVQLVGSNAVESWQRVASRFGDSVTSSGSNEEAEQQSQSYFAAGDTTAQFNNCTLCVIKPHSVASGDSGRIIDAILGEGFEINAIDRLNLDRVAAEEFLEVYKNVVPEYQRMVDHLISGACIALEVGAETQAFREFCGPADVDIAKELRPRTLRANFGVDNIRNAVHCTDLPEDGVLESEYFFKILQASK